jgi:hypothetical protein
MRNLSGGRPSANAWEDARCLACHTAPTNAADTGEAARAVREQGVTCDACHGPGGSFGPDHLRWHHSGRRRDDYAAGATWLGDPVSRGQVCVGCHVGAAADPTRNLPIRDVNHDLIAAGHPRLTFEPSLFLANMPPHWDETDRTRPDAATTWLAGQLCSAQASLKLLAHQARPGPAGGPSPPWPELARFDCFACHHNLAGPGGSQQRGKGGRLVPNAGDLPWPLRRLLEQDDPESAAAVGQLHAALTRPADRAAVADRADRLAERIGRRLDALGTDPTAVSTDHILSAFRKGLGQPDPLTWDDAAQLFYALDSLHKLGPDEPALRAALTWNADGPAGFRPADVADRFRRALGR